jgi:hypothetical protein
MGEGSLSWCKIFFLPMASLITKHVLIHIIKMEVRKESFATLLILALLFLPTPMSLYNIGMMRLTLHVT